MNRTWSTRHLKCLWTKESMRKLPTTFLTHYYEQNLVHTSFKDSHHYFPQLLYIIHCVTIDCRWSLLFSLFSNWAHTKGFFFCDQSIKPLHFIDLDNVIHTLKVLSLLLYKCFLCVNFEFSVFLYILNLYLIWMMRK